MGKKITGDRQVNGSVPWIYTDHGRTWVGVDYTANVPPAQYEVRRDSVGVAIANGDSVVWLPHSVIPFLIRALKKK
jgi:hypothetical protein